jgi:hypothetical protein
MPMTAPASSLAAMPCSTAAGSTATNRRRSTPCPEAARIPHAEAFVAALGIPATLDADAAYYRIDLDRIFMPAFASFQDPLSYVATYIHEAGRATGAKHRLDRDFSTRFSSEALAVEELVAELTAGYVLSCAPPAPRPRRLYRRVVQASEGRPPPRLHRGQQGAAGGRLDGRAAAAAGPVARRGVAATNRFTPRQGAIPAYSLA